MNKGEKKKLQELVNMIGEGYDKKDLLVFLQNEDAFKDFEIPDPEILIEDNQEDNEENGYTFEVLDIVKMNRDVKKSFIQVPSKEEARFLMDIYYQMQARRIALEGQLRSLQQGVDTDVEENNQSSKNKTFMEWYLYNTKQMEDQIKAALDIFSDNHYLSRWAKKNIGIGPVISTCLTAQLELKKNEDGSCSMHAGNWWSYCGLNNNNRPWIGRVESAKILDQCIKDNDGKLDDQTVWALAAKSGWSIEHFSDCKSESTGNWSKEKLEKKASMIPYNKNLKLVMYKIGHSFTMVKNKGGSLYGRLLKERLDYENRKNENGDYANQATEILAKKNIGKNTDAYKAYSQGKLPPAHIIQRCERYVTKLFISHLFEAAYYNEYGEMPPQPYVLKFCEGHVDYIGPEVQYDSVDRD